MSNGKDIYLFSKGAQKKRKGKKQKKELDNLRQKYTEDRQGADKRLA